MPIVNLLGQHLAVCVKSIKANFIKDLSIVSFYEIVESGPNLCISLVISQIVLNVIILIHGRFM